MKFELAAARKRIEACHRALVVTHIMPDGDAFGSLLGFGLALRAAGKEVVFSCADVMLETFRYLPASNELTTTPSGEFDLIVAVDISDESRMGVIRTLIPRPPDLQFDHHVTNPGYATINFIDAASASTAEFITELLPELGLPLTQDVAICLLTGLVTDTLGFRTSNTTSKTLALAQKLMAAGANLAEIYDASLNKRSIYAVRLWAHGLANIQIENRVVWATLPLTARKAAQYNGKGDADLINVLSTIREADIAVVLTEREDGKVKVSWRSGPKVNVAALAASFGGGGHAPAAGAEIVGTLEEVTTKVLAATKKLLNA